jgi:hypothetical protein
MMMPTHEKSAEGLSEPEMLIFEELPDDHRCYAHSTQQDGAV